MVKYGRDRQATNDNIIWHVHFACWIIKATNAHSEYVILFMATVVAPTRLSVMFIVHCLSLYHSFPASVLTDL